MREIENNRHHKPRRLPALVFAALLLLLLTATGCWGRREIEERAFIHILGVDKGLGAELRVTASIAIPRALSPEQTGRGGTGVAMTLASEGFDLTDALNRIESLIARELTGQHIACLILGEEFAMEDIAPIMDVFHRSIEFRPTTLVAVCRGEAGKFIARLKTPEESSVSQYITKTIESGNRALGFCPVVTMHDFSERYQTPEFSPWAPLLDLAAPVAAEDPGMERSQSGDGSDNQELLPAAIAGTALFALDNGKYRMVGHLHSEETRAALVMYGQAGNWYLDIKSPGDFEGLSLLMVHTSSRVDVDRKGNSVSAKFTIRVSGTIDEYVPNPKAPPTTDEIRRAIAETAQQRIEELCKMSFNKMMGLRCDAIALGKTVHGTFRTMPEWEAFDWPSKLTEVTASFDVKVDVYSSGYSFQRAYPR